MNNYFDRWSETILKYRPYLIAFSFRMTGSLAEAEDIVSDTILECSKYNPMEIKNHKAWLTKICSNKALDYLKSARKKRESYVGVWLPDEVPSGLQIWGNLEEVENSEHKLILDESLTTSFLLLLQKLTPQERVIYLLSEIFDYSFKEISDFLGKNIPACKKIAQRARDGISSERVKFDLPPKESEEILRRFFVSAKNGNIQDMIDLLSSDSELWGDGGGKVSAAGFINSIEMIFNFFNCLVTSEVFKSDLYRSEIHTVNSRPGVVISKKDNDKWLFDTILSFEFKGDKIARIYAQRNPDKLSSLTKLNA